MRSRNGVRDMRLASWTGHRGKHFRIRILILSRARKSGRMPSHRERKKTPGLPSPLAKLYFLRPVSSRHWDLFLGRLDAHAFQNQEIEFFLAKKVANLAGK